jgi:SpoVK/Ycf46/Vps4 family AAA+-type ATPase
MIERSGNFMNHIGTSRLPLLQAASNAFKNIQKGKGPTLITFWGNQGIGKTTLLHSIASYLQADQDATIIEAVWEKGILQSSRLREALHQEAPDNSAGEPAVVLIDNVDELLRADSQAFFKFEQDIILPMIEQGGFLILTTSQIELNQWREDDVRVRQVNYHIPALTVAEVATLLDTTKIPAETVYELTFGQPMVASWLLEDPALDEKKIASKAWKYFLKNISQEALPIASIICLLPIFNIYLLQQILKSETLEEAPYVECLECIKEYIRHGLVYWDVSIGSYRFTDSAVRRLLARQVLYHEPEKFNKINTIASNYYQAEAASPGYLHMHFVSAIYHLAQMKRALSQEEIGEACLGWIKSKTNSWLSAHWDEVIMAWEDGAGEPAVAEEIRILIGQKYFRKITQQIKAAKRNLEATK